MECTCNTRKTLKAEIDIDQMIKKTYWLLNNRPEIFRVEKIRGTAGICDGGTITINYKHDILSTLFHEVFHYYYPDWSETKVLYNESYIINNISKRRAVNVLKKFASIL